MGDVYKMSRYHESKLPELDQHVDNIENRIGFLESKIIELKRSEDEIKELEVIELAFKDRCRCGVAEINRFLERGFEIYHKQSTESGFIFFMAKWGLKE